jgi:hypothetical protein
LGGFGAYSNGLTEPLINQNRGVVRLVTVVISGGFRAAVQSGSIAF